MLYLQRFAYLVVFGIVCCIYFGLSCLFLVGVGGWFGRVLAFGWRHVFWAGWLNLGGGLDYFDLYTLILGSAAGVF